MDSLRETRQHGKCKKVPKTRDEGDKRKCDKKMVRNANRRMERKLTKDKNDKNGGNFTRFIKSKTKSITGIGLLTNSVGVLETEKREMAGELNKFFNYVFMPYITASRPQLTEMLKDAMDPIVLTK
jgi:hypothetical protein